MYKETQDRKKRVNSRIKWKRKIHIHILFIVLIIITYFLFSNNIVVDEDTWSVTIVESPKIITEKFNQVYSWKIESWKTLDFDLDLTDVFLTGALANIEFSNNKDFKLYPIWSDENINKVRFWYMLWKSRNKNQVYWVWKVNDSLKKISHEIVEDQEDWRLYFRSANLGWWNLYVKITLVWEKIINNKKD